MAYNTHVSSDSSTVGDSTTIMATEEVNSGLDYLSEEDASKEDVDSLFGDPISDEHSEKIISNADSGSTSTITRKPFLALPPGGIVRTGTPPQEVQQPVEAKPLVTPQKRGRGRPKGSKSPPKPVVHYRCRYGCERQFNAIGLRKHMSRVHCVFSSAHNDSLRTCICGRKFDPANSSLACTKRYNNPDMDNCKTPSAAAEALFNVPEPRDAQEAADTFAYDGEGPNGERPSDLVIVREGDDEEERREANAEAIKNWKPQATGAATGDTSVKSSTSSTQATPRSLSSTVVDLTGDNEIEVLPSPPAPMNTGRGTKRAADWVQLEPKRVALGPMIAAINQPGNTGFSAAMGAAPIMAGFNPAIPTIVAPQFSAAPVPAQVPAIDYGYSFPVPTGQDLSAGMQAQGIPDDGGAAIGGFGSIGNNMAEAVMCMFDGTTNDIDYSTLPTEFVSAETAEAARNFRM